MARAGRQTGLRRWAWVVVASVAVFELLADARARTDVPSDASWHAAADFVRERFQHGDQIVASPGWTNPIVRRELGDLMTVASIGHGDLAEVGRRWEVGLDRDGTSAAAPEVDVVFDGVRVRAYPVGRAPPRFDFANRLQQADVQYRTASDELVCPWTHAPVRGGGLGLGPLPPDDRFVCDLSRPWFWVGPTVMADLDLRPRRCIWQHPIGAEPVSVRYHAVPLADELVVEGGLDYNNARVDSEVPVRLAVYIDDRLAGELRIRGRDGWRRLSLDTSAYVGSHHDVRFETTAPFPDGRTFCWAAVTRAAEALP